MIMSTPHQNRIPNVPSAKWLSIFLICISLEMRLDARTVEFCQHKIYVLCTEIDLR